MDAEQAYLFRHAVLRDAAYALQLPAERAVLHRLALTVLELIHHDAERDSLAAELAEHAHYAQTDSDASTRAAELAYTWRAARFYQAANNPDAVRWFDRAAALEPDSGRRARALRSAGDLLSITGGLAEGLPRLLEAMELAKAQGDVQFQGSVNLSLSMISHFQGRREEAEALVQKALEMSRTVGDLQTEAAATNSLSVLVRIRGDHARSFELLQRTLQLVRQSGNRPGEAATLGNVALYQFDSGRHDDALVTCEQSLAAARECNSRRVEGINHGIMGMILAHVGRAAEAADHFRRALVLHRETFNRAYEAYDRCRLALAILQLGDAGQAQSEWRHGYEQMLAWGDKPDLDETRKNMLQACARAGIAPFIATSGTG